MIIFSCYWCGFSEEYDKPPCMCPRCEGKSYTLSYEKKQRSGMSRCFEDHPRWSDALGVNPNQIPEFKRRFGDLMEFDNEGRCLVKNRQHKKQLLKARDLSELD